jgi:hypothetical protein
MIAVTTSSLSQLLDARTAVSPWRRNFTSFCPAGLLPVQWGRSGGNAKVSEGLQSTGNTASQGGVRRVTD